MFGHPIYSGERQENDYYPTPVECIDPLLQLIDFTRVKSFLEPCRGELRSIYNRVPVPGDRKLWAELSEGVDYFGMGYGQVDLIITNPPFCIALDFLKKSLREAETVCYLLRLGFMGSQERAPFWRENPPTHLFTVSKRPSFAGTGNDKWDVGWFCWDRAGVIKAREGLHWI